MQVSLPPWRGVLDDGIMHRSLPSWRASLHDGRMALPLGGSAAAGGRFWTHVGRLRRPDALGKGPPAGATGGARELETQCTSLNTLPFRRCCRPVRQEWCEQPGNRLPPVMLCPSNLSNLSRRLGRATAAFPRAMPGHVRVDGTMARHHRKYDITVDKVPVRWSPT